MDKSGLQTKHTNKIETYFDNDNVYWRTVYTDSDRASGFISYEMKNRRRLVSEQLAQLIGNRAQVILDCGCGSGVIMGDMISRGYTVIGVDISSEQLKSAREYFTGIVSDNGKQLGASHLVQTDVEHLPFKDNSFDAAYAVGVLQYLKTDTLLVRELSRIVKPGGYIIITLPNLLKISNFLDPYYYFIRSINLIRAKLLLHKHSSVKLKDIHDFADNTSFSNRRYIYGQLNRLFSSCNLETLQTLSVSFGALTFWKKKLIPDQLSIKLSASLSSLSRRIKPLRFVANRWIILLRKTES